MPSSLCQSSLPSRHDQGGQWKAALFSLGYFVAPGLPLAWPLGGCVPDGVREGPFSTAQGQGLGQEQSPAQISGSLTFWKAFAFRKWEETRWKICERPDQQVCQAVLESSDTCTGPLKRTPVFQDPKVILIELFLRKFHSGDNVEGRLVVVRLPPYNKLLALFNNYNCAWSHPSTGWQMENCFTKWRRLYKCKVIINMVLGYCFIWGQFSLFLEDFE